MSQWEGLNRRKFPRVEYPCLVILKAGDGTEQQFMAHTENIGVGGVCLIVKENVKMFSQVNIKLDLMDLEDQICCQGKVVWNVQRKDHDPDKPLFYDIGIEFEHISDAERGRINKIVDMIAEKTEGKE